MFVYSSFIGRTLPVPFVFFLAILSIGCDNRTALERRMDEFRYDTDSLAKDLEVRLKSVNKKTRTRESSKAESVRNVESDRGSDAGRPEPNSMEAIVLEMNAKIDSFADSNEKSSVLDALLSKLKESEEVGQDTIGEFEMAMRASLN